MHIVYATEIWGRTPHADVMAETLGHMAGTVTVVDPYDGENPAFASEEAAYSAYKSRCGHAEFARRVIHAASEAAEPVCLVGFSAGAGAVWAAACTIDGGNTLAAFCFYGSSIREMTNLTPSVPVELVFPDHESHFDVHALALDLDGNKGTKCHMTPYGHGFMNPLSTNFDKGGCTVWTHWLKQRVASLAH